MKTVLVTGSLGLAGSACVEHFNKKGWEVVGIDNNSRAHFFGTEEQMSHEGRFLSVDIRDEGAVNNLFEMEKFDAIVHCAAQPSHDYATDHVLEDFHVNATGTLNLLEATRKYCPDAVFVFVSTDKVYGENMKGEGLSDESLGLDFAGVRSFFGCSKTAADMYAQEYAARFGMKVGIFRPGCITGKNHQGVEQHGFLSYLAKCIKEGIEYKVHGNGKQVRDQVHAKDLAKAFDYFIQNPKAGTVYNIGGGPDRSVSLLEAVRMLEEKTGKKANLKYGEPHRKGDRLYDVHDISKFKKDYPEFEYTYSLNDIMNELVL